MVKRGERSIAGNQAEIGEDGALLKSLDAIKRVVGWAGREEALGAIAYAERARCGCLRGHRGTGHAHRGEQRQSQQEPWGNAVHD